MALWSLVGNATLATAKVTGTLAWGTKKVATEAAVGTTAVIAKTVMSEILIRTAARWRISRDLALAVIARDTQCIYCRRDFAVWPGLRAALASWEHIVNDSALVNEANIALCCVGCNSSKGRKSLEDWLKSKYCVERKITKPSLPPFAVGGPAERQSASSTPTRRDGLTIAIWTPPERKETDR